MANMKVSPRLPVPSLQATAETADTTSASTLFSVMLSSRRVIRCGVSDRIGKNSTTPRLQYRERLIAGTWYPECFYGLSRAIRPARANLAAQQRAFNAFRQEYNEERLHGLDECDDGIWSVFCNTVLLAKLDERDLILRD